MKKLLLGLGAITSIAAPVAAVISCDNDNTKPVIPTPPAAYIVDVNKGTKAFKDSDKATTEELEKGIDEAIKANVPLTTNDTTKNHPVGPNSAAAHNYSGAIGILNATYENLLAEDVSSVDNKAVMKNVQAIMKALLLNKEILTNNAKQNLNTQELANTVYAAIKAKTIAVLKGNFDNLDLGLKFKAGNEKDKSVITSITDGKVTFDVKKAYIFNVGEGTKIFNGSDKATETELKKGLKDKISSYVPLTTNDTTKNHPVGPNSAAAHNYSGAIGILNATYMEILDGATTISPDNEPVMKNVQAIMKALLLNKEILTNNAKQNLNNITTAKKLYEAIKGLTITGLKKPITNLDSGLKFEAGNNKDGIVLISVSDKYKVSFTKKA